MKIKMIEGMPESGVEGVIERNVEGVKRGVRSRAR